MNGNCRPTMAPSVLEGVPVTAPSTVTGTPSAPNATGAVLKINTKTKASSAGNPTRIRSEDVIAIGVPKPAMPSSSAPKQKPITTSTIRRSFGKWSRIQKRKASKRPEFDRNVVEQERVDDDPHHRPQRKHDAVQDRVRREMDREAPDRDGEDQADGEAGERGLPGGAADDAEEDKDREHRQNRHKKRQRQAIRHRRQQLAKHAPSLARGFDRL